MKKPENPEAVHTNNLIKKEINMENKAMYFRQR